MYLNEMREIFGGDLKVSVCPMDKVAVAVQRAVLSDVDLVRLTKVNLRTLKNLYKQQFTDTRIFVGLRGSGAIGKNKGGGLRPEIRFAENSCSLLVV